MSKSLQVGDPSPLSRSLQVGDPSPLSRLRERGGGEGPLLEVINLRTEISTGSSIVVAVDGADYAIQPGETFALVGESGCGKSLSALSVMRLLPDNGRVGAGAIVLRGTDIVPMPEKHMRDLRGRAAGIIFQEPATSLNPVMRVGEQIVEVIERHTLLRRGAARARALEWLRRVGIPDPERRIDAFPFELSGGQKQRVMIAIALAAEPELLIADEPTTALDVTIQAQILELLRDLQRERGMAILLITHDLAVVSGMAHRVALMYAGQVVEVSDAAEFFARPLHPYAQLLFGAIPGADRRGAELAAIPGTVPPLDQHFTGCRFAPRCNQAGGRCGEVAPAMSDQGGAKVRCHRYDGGVGVVAEPALIPSLLPQAGEGRSIPPVHKAGEGRSTPPLHNVSPFSREREKGGDEGPPLLELKDYKVWFPQSGGLFRKRTWFHAVDGISFRLEAGRTLALVGESGCGKTTTGKAIVQLLRGAARIEGSAKLSGTDLGTLEGTALRAARREIQIIFQDPFASLNPRMRVIEILEEGVKSLRPEIAAAERRERILGLVRTVGLHEGAIHRYPHEFSGGQRQRIAIARALAVEPRLIVCDEPTSALDVSVQAQILNLLARLQRERGLAYLFITHNFGVVEYLADSVTVMRDGRILETGAAGETLGNPRDEYTKTLLAAVPRLRRVA